MNALSNTNTTLLAWVEVTPRHFEFQADGEVIATLRWPKPFRSVALGDLASGLLIFKQVGRFGSRFRVRDGDTGADVALLGKTAVDKPAILRLCTGETLSITLTDTDGVTLQDNHGKDVLSLRDDMYSSRRTLRLTRGPAWPNSPAGLLLSMVGLYLLELQAEDNLAALVSATTLLNVN